MSIGRKIFKGSAYRTGTHFLTMVMAFLLLPIIVNGLGAEDYAIWVIVAALAGYYGALDFGLSSAVIRFVSKHIQKPQIVQEYLATSFVIFLILSCIIVLVALIVALSLNSIGSLEGINSTIRIIVFITGLSTAVSFISKTSIGLMSSLLRYEVIATIQFAVAVFRSIGTYIIITLGGGLLELALFLLVCSTIEALTLLFFGIKEQHPSRFFLKNFRRERAIEMFNYSKYTFIAQVADILRNNALPLLIAGLIDVRSVAPFAIAMRLWSMMSAISSSMLSIFTPVFSRFDDNKEKIKEIYFNALKFSNYIGVFNCIFLLVIMRPFLDLWLGIEISKEVYPIAILISISYISAISQMPTVNLLYGLSENKKYAYSNLAQGVLTVVVSYFASIYWGVIGIAIGFSIVGFTTKMIIQLSYAIQVLDLNPARYFYNIFKFLTLPCCYGLLALSCIDFISTLSISLQLLLTILFYTLYLSNVYHFCLKPSEKISIQNIIFRSLNT